VETIVPHLVHARPARTRIPPPTSEATSDVEFVTLAQRHPEAFAQIYARYLDPVHRYCYRRLGSREAAEDATSLVFAKALSALPRYHGTSFRSWLFTIAHHVIVDRYRDAQPEQPLDTAIDILDGAPSPEELVIAADERRAVRALLGQLPEHQRRVIELRLAGLTGAEIAQALGRTQANVDVTQYRAVARLRGLLGLSAEAPETSHAN
jgi:RNA polymerase sigma-70 factor (ECF subfamily)